MRQPFDYMGMARMTPRVAPHLMGQTAGNMQGVAPGMPTKLAPEPPPMPVKLPPELPNVPTKLPPEMPMNPTPMLGGVHNPVSMAQKLKAMQIGSGGMRFPF